VAQIAETNQHPNVTKISLAVRFFGQKSGGSPNRKGGTSNTPSTVLASQVAMFVAVTPLFSSNGMNCMVYFFKPARGVAQQTVAIILHQQFIGLRVIHKEFRVGVELQPRAALLFQVRQMARFNSMRIG